MANRKDIYSEAEVGEIIRRAIEVQESNSTEPYIPGVTRDELERIAKEMGITGAALDRALSETHRKTEKTPSPLRFKDEIEHVVDGELDPNDFDLVASKIPGSYQMLPTQVGRTLVAKVRAGMASTQVSVSSRKGRTKVKVESTASLPIVFGFQSIFFASIFGSALLAKGVFFPGIILVLSLLSIAAMLLTKGVSSAHKSAAQLADKLTGAVEETLGHSEETDVRASLRSAAEPAAPEIENRSNEQPVDLS